MSVEEANKGNDKLLLKYVGLATQLMISLALGVFLGLKLDKWLHLSTPLLVWILPLLILVVMIWQIIKDTSKKK
ncbi:MAG TPA: AtpZ/AtpI family protein [Segetibacter sp.]|nr:AtpZ/AtpI family protein [Segetibacter sp.]